MINKWILLGVFGVTLVVNPYLACSSKDDEFSYSEAELKQAVLGNWVGTADIDGESFDFSLVLEQAPAKSETQSTAAPQVQPQCAQRSIVKPAGACISMTQMAVVGTLTSVNPALNGSLDGDVYAYKDLGPAELELRLEDGKQLAGRIEKQALSDGSVTAPAKIGGFSLARP